MYPHEIRTTLKEKEKKLEWENGLYPALNKDLHDATNKVKRIEAEVAKLRKENKEHQAKAKETKQLFNWRQKERDAERICEQQPGKIQTLQQAIKDLKEKLNTATTAEKERKAAYEAGKAAAQASQLNTAVTLPPTSGIVAGTKRKATEEPQQQPKRQKAEGTPPPVSASRQLTPQRQNKSATNRGLAPSGQRRATQTGRGGLRPQQSSFTKSEDAPPASRQPNKAKVDAATIKAASDATAGALSSASSNATHGQGKKSTTATNVPPSSRKTAGDPPAGQRAQTKPGTGMRAGATAPQGTGSNSRISKTSRPTNGAATSTTATAGKKRKETSNSTSSNKSTREKGASSRRNTRSTGPIEQRKEDTPPIKNKKRGASDDDSDDRGGKKQKTVNQDPKPAPLSNWSQACFSNVIIELLDAGLGGHGLDALLGEVKNSEPFSSTTGRKMIEVIKAAAVAGEAEKVSAVKHLRELLGNMHAEYNAQTEKTVDPKIFQLAVAYGAAEDAIRNAMDGGDQQDAFEYYQLLLNILLEDPFLANGEELRAQFEIETEIRDKCKACDHKSEPRIATNNYHGIDVPAESDPDFDFDADWETTNDLFFQSMYNEGECNKCNKSELQSRTEITKLPENIVIKLNRTRFADNQATKVETIVPYAEKIFPRIKSDEDEEEEYKEVPYELSAGIMHKGDTIQEGHYTIYRKQGDNWFLLDDREKVSVPVLFEEMADTAKDVDAEQPAIMSAMMLYKKAPVEN